MKNLLKDKEAYGKMEKLDVINAIRDQINELRSVSLRPSTSRDNFEKASWPYLQAYEMGIQKVLNQLEDYINI
jgi:hypothetical protein